MSSCMHDMVSKYVSLRLGDKGRGRRRPFHAFTVTFETDREKVQRDMNEILYHLDEDSHI
jgi:hypothetical protein